MSHSVDLVAIGASLGGTEALATILRGLSPRLRAAIAIVLHRRPSVADELVAMLRRSSPLPVREPDDKDAVAPGTVYIAPADYHLLVSGGRFTLSTEAPVCLARPSIDVLFASVALEYGPRAMGIVLSGASKDGAAGLARMRERGAPVLVQNPEGARAPKMPRAALARAAGARVLGLSEIATAIMEVAALEEVPT